MIIDMHAHLGPILRQHHESMVPLFEAYTGEQLIALMDAAGIDRAVVFAPRWKGGELIDPNYELANRAVYEAAQAFPKRLMGFGRVNPNFGAQALAEIRRCFEAYGFLGIKLHPEWDSFNPNSQTLVYPLMETARERGAPVLFHTGYFPAEPGLFLELAEAFPDVPIIMGHMGQRLLADTLIVAERAPNVFLETSGSTEPFVNTAVRRIGAERVLFGTNVPFLIPRAEMVKIEILRALTDEQKALIFGGNAARLLRLEA